MITFEINKTFKTQKECEEWKDKNLPNRTYKGHVIMCVNHESSIHSDSVTLKSIMCF